MADSSRTVCLHDQSQIEAFLRQDVFLHLYAIGDLDDHFWPFTTWYGLEHKGRLQAVALVYSGLSVPTLLAFGADEGRRIASLVQSLVGLLPRQFYAHLSPGLTTILQQIGTVTSHDPHYKMALVHPARLDSVDTSDVQPLSDTDAPALCPFFAQNYPRNWFDPRMLGTGQYFGLSGPDGFLSVAGVHVYSERYRVAALGNVATHAAHRGEGLASRVVAALCQNLRRTVDHIGLNVAAGNSAAVRCYQRLGFEIVAEYEECEVTLS